MRVKNGTASKVSLAMMPIRRCGSQAITVEGNTPISIPTKPKKRPQAPRLKATGKPSSKNIIKPANMIGAKLAAKNSMVCSARLALGYCAWRGAGVNVFGSGLGAQGFGQILFRRFIGQAAHGVRSLAKQKGDAFDQF